MNDQSKLTNSNSVSSNCFACGIAESCSLQRERKESEKESDQQKKRMIGKRKIRKVEIGRVSVRC